MNYSYVLTGLVLLGLVLLSVACAPNRPFRTSLDPYNRSADAAGQDPANHAVIETTEDYLMGFVEFDEEGWFWDKANVNHVKDEIRKAANTNGTNNAAGIVMLVFVHGWKNNAAYNCGNVVTFRKALQQLNAAEKEQALSSTPPRPIRKIVGVYCGWRGLSSTIEPFKELSFWKRKATAHKVGGYSAMTQFLVELAQLQDDSNRSIAPGGARTELIIVGHSFGGAAVYSAISEFVTENFVESVERGEPLKPLGDQVILLNPAFEASRHYNLNRLATGIQKYPDAQRPVLSIFTSKGDWATHYALPAGRFFATLFEKFRDAEQRHATREAVGWFQPFVTHTLDYNNAATLGAAPTNTSTYNPQKKKHEINKTDTTRLRQSVQNVRQQRAKWVPNNTVPQTYYFDDCILKPKDTFKPGDPFLIVAVDKKIMKDHDDIDNPILVNFLREYIEFCHQPVAQPALVKH